MYEKLVIHAIHHPDTNDLEMRYRKYKSKEERDKTYDGIIKNEGNRGKISKVTLTIIAEPVSEQLTLGL